MAPSFYKLVSVVFLKLKGKCKGPLIAPYVSQPEVLEKENVNIYCIMILIIIIFVSINFDHIYLRESLVLEIRILI